MFLGVPVANLSTYGYKMIMNEFYSFVVTNNYIQITIRSQCNKNSRLCIGGSDKTGTTLQLLACGNCFVITNPTVRNEPVLENGVYWYFTPGQSFGYSPVYEIYQINADIIDIPDIINKAGTGGDKRLSWHTGRDGGWRLGRTFYLNNSNDYKKMIFLKN